MTCDCRICKRHREFKAWLKTIPKAARPFAENLMLELDHSEDHADYLQAIVDGSWPSADQQIALQRKSREKDDKKRKEKT